MKEMHATNDAVTRHLLDAIERVRDDVAKVEFWAGAVAGFSQPVPEYSPDEATVWLPNEQADTLRSKLDAPKSTRRNAGKNGKALQSKARTRTRG